MSKDFYITYEPTLQELCHLATKLDDTITLKYTINIISATTGEIYAMRDQESLWSFCGYKRGEM